MASSPVVRDSSFGLEPHLPMLGDAEEDALPPYTNNIRLATLCHRKREFHAALEKTRRGRRTWEIVWLVLDGTALRIYKPEPEEKKVMESMEALRLNRTNSGDSTRSKSHHLGLPHGSRSERRGVPATLPQTAAAKTRSSLPTPLVSSSEPRLPLSRATQSGTYTTASSTDELRSRRRRVGSIIKASARPPPQYPMNTTSNQCSASTPFLIGTATRESAPTLVQVETPDFSKRKSSRQYHLQHAVCMKPDAYSKREHVLRFIFEGGKQFLIQLSNRAETIAWLQLMSIAAPLSLDLDERPMPEPAYYPRRRPRTRANRRPATAPGVLETGTVPPQSPSADSGPSAVPDIWVDPATASTDIVENVADIGEDEVDDGQEMDHLPPPRRPQLIRSLSSVEQARRMGIQI